MYNPKLLLLAVAISAVVVSSASAQIFATKEFYEAGLGFRRDGKVDVYPVADLYIEYQKNGVAWEERYAGKQGFISGVIQSIGRDIVGQRVIELRAIKPNKNLDYWETVDVMYPENLPENLKRELASYKIGQTVELMVQFRKEIKEIDIIYYDENYKK